MQLIVSLVIIISLQTCCCNGDSLDFNISNYNPLNKDTHIQIKFYNLSSVITNINIVNIPSNVGFFVVQVHSYLHNVTLSSTPEMESQTYVKGTNVGLVGTGTASSTFYLTRYDYNMSVLIVVTIYETNDPIPGGCNLTFDTQIAPYQLVSYTDELIIVKSQPPSTNKLPCELNNVQADMYHMYLKENSYDPTFYFEALKNMLTVDNIKLNGRKVTTIDGYFKYNKLYSSYRGIGQVFAIIARFNNRTSSYIPAISFGCDIENWAEDCYGPVTPHWKLICAFLLIFGLFVCFFGHKYFRTTICLIGFTTGIFVTYTLISINDTISVGERTMTSLIVGLIYGTLWLFVWRKFGIPILSISLTIFLAAFLVAATIFYTGIADMAVFTNDINFWVTSSSLIMAFFILWTMFTLPGHIFACSFLGSYASITALNYYTGGNLQYIIINAFRRIVVRNFNMATVDPPFQSLDIAQTVLWGVMTGYGCYYQWREQIGKPPFPPHRYATDVVHVGVSENTPLLRNSAVVDVS